MIRSAHRQGPHFAERGDRRTAPWGGCRLSGHRNAFGKPRNRERFPMTAAVAAAPQSGAEVPQRQHRTERPVARVADDVRDRVAEKNRREQCPG